MEALEVEALTMPFSQMEDHSAVSQKMEERKAGSLKSSIMKCMEHWRYV